MGVERPLVGNRRGNMALFAMATLAVAVLIIGGVIDFMSLVLQRRDLQNAADHAALSAAHELVLASDAEERIQPVAAAFIKANYELEASTDAEIIDGGAAVRVQVTSPPRVFFAGPVGMNAKPMVVESIAEVVGQEANVCVIALDEDSDRSISLDSTASLDAPDCAIYSNSTKKKSISALSNSRLVGNLICSAGGTEGGASNFDPEPLEDCPAIGDPLAGRPGPPVGPCDHDKFKKKDFVGTISPGVYCDGLEIKGSSKITFAPGVYVIKDGDFKVDDNSEVTGEHVGFFMTGSNGRFEFTHNAKVHFSAPKDGPMAGLLFMEDNTILKETKHRITSDYADYLVGTIYLPRGSFLIDANQDIAAASEFTVLVVRQLELKAGPHLVLNTDYGATTVPVPEGVGNNGPKGVRLIQ